jgi:spore germination cell wall hydrolase CwlJ-like protein
MRSKRAPARRAYPLRISLALSLLLLGTTRAAYQDLGSLFAQQPGVADRARAQLMWGAMSSLKTATLSLPTNSLFALPEAPIRTALQPAALQQDADLEIIGSIPPANAMPQQNAAIAPAIERKNKANRLDYAPTPVSFPPYDISLSLELEPDVPDANAVFETAEEPRADRAGNLAHATDLPTANPDSLMQIARLFFDADDAALPPGAFRHRQAVPPAVVPDTSPDAAPNATRKRTPAERLELAGAKRQKAHQCLANAIYFEARSEPEKGQIAVAQVVINRAFSGYYPNDICGVVYQNKHRHLSCQFTFACDGIPDVVYDKGSWATAERIANETLDGKLYLDDVGKATHYHAYYVSPYWARSMRKMARIGAHTFYFPRQWEVNEPPSQTAAK